ncbi:MAG: sugar phosphate isomerase/epimerase [Spirochaetaceae bacterium]|nr:MAG: sugar phosphate isomerase/epimerase [Spirochaetaceae bacterium]
MIKLGVNSVLFRDYDFATAVKHIATCGYDGVEISAIEGMCEHLVLSRWKEQAAEIKTIVADAGLEILSAEVAALKEERLLPAFEAAAEIGIPVINVGPGGKSDVEDDIVASIEKLNSMAEKAAGFGVALCVKAHVNSAIYNTPTTLRAMKAISSSAFGIDMDPSHIYRAGEDPAKALGAVVSRMKHVHIRDCKGRQSGPGTPRDQACGRGDIDLVAYCRVLVEAGYDGPVCLEVIGAENHDLPLVCTIAAESFGYLNACLKTVGGR